MYHELTEKIEQLLREQCSTRCLDEEADIKAVIETINTAVEKWISDRCPGCR